MKEIKLPELGENIDTATVLKVLVNEGQSVDEEQPLLELESEKTAFELPAPAGGRITEIKVDKGDELTSGDVVLVLEQDGTGGDAHASDGGERDADRGDDEAKDDAKDDDAGGRASVRAEAGDEEPTRAPADHAREPEESTERDGDPAAARLANELGVDLESIQQSSSVDRVTTEDVKAYVRGRMRIVAPPGDDEVQLPDFTRWGPVERADLSSIQRATGERLMLAWHAIPQVTHHDESDVSVLEELRLRYRDRHPEREPALTITPFLLRAVARALGEHPRVNSSVDASRGELILKQSKHIGIAVDTDDGLLVPVLRKADTRGILELAQVSAQLAERARSRKLQDDELQGATFTVTNLGGIGGRSFTPIVPFPQVAILGVARAAQDPGTGRWRLPLSLSYDHRALDGAQAARFLRAVIARLECPLDILLTA